MKTVTGRVLSAESISLSKAAKLISGFASSDNGASQAVSAYLRRASTAFTELKSIHREIKSKETKPRSDSRRERNPNSEFDQGKTRFRKSETASEKEAIYGREQDEIKEDKKKKKSKKNKEEDVIDEKVNEKLEEEQRNEERKERKKEKKKKKRNSDEEIGSEERKSKKKKKSKEIDG